MLRDEGDEFVEADVGYFCAGRGSGVDGAAFAGFANGGENFENGVGLGKVGWVWGGDEGVVEEGGGIGDAG